MSAPGGGSTPPPDQDLGDQGDHEYVEAGDEDDMYAPVFLGDEHGEVVADLDEEDDAPMSDSDDDEVDPATHPGVA